MSLWRESPLFSILAQIPGVSDTGESVLELSLWIFLLVLFIVSGVLIATKLRQEAKSGSPPEPESNPLNRFEQLRAKKLITYDEFEMIKKNLRDQMVFDVYHEAKKKEKGKKPGKRGKNSPKSRDDVLDSLLKGIRD